MALTRLADDFQRVQTTDGFVTVADTDGTLIEFAGTPDTIELLCTTFDVILTLTDRARSRDVEIIVLAATRYEHRGGGFDTLLARNRVGGSAGIVQAIGKWARPALAPAPAAPVAATAAS